MTHEEIKDLISFLDEKASINRLKIKDKDFELEIKKEDAACANAAISAPAPACTPAPSVNVVLSEKPATNKTAAGDTINSPMVGTFYKAPSPGASPFVSVGQAVRKGECVGIIEAMKIMNEIEAEFDCRIVKVLVDDGQPVEYGMAIYEVEKL
ncbi:MAG: acetyl-CoA carboxylase biotin carboxyl carrier protein [Campylobacter sp.]|uniref:acetyl-CoA carboxylase biotin carboxyl carrier protein n=1 Tax=Campylobacter sp. TaxID=205 RepID=UPI002A823B81|nr:acetyl-CoA carboxylase biotin carboxyl carrier protein [Campylobacter sp.]MCI6177852.1 acetyl-CoA carboxylase biotin carboxyl carrier protein [Campylobacter sp.]MCI6343731.1 acetyl-CoA carboxylase biotin carboxyl carrier protein [Campylobacter sp.]MCI7103908.1 acetyl-CoA carboxylase biotin carboxyl carrier protein [Campylobacter sp.]MCI7237329.1 acetyl-CoA carboxylase biotin carboxyl carrier protein [Campylobacter sp.]MDY3663422.1 acetyl-CoA carboxylase biotin carboxyl carrier protein [Camp